MAEADDDENGEIDFCEFVQMMVKHKQKEDMDHELEEAFKVFLQSRRAAEAFFGVIDGDWCGLSFHTLYAVGRHVLTDELEILSLGSLTQEPSVHTPNHLVNSPFGQANHRLTRTGWARARASCSRSTLHCCSISCGPAQLSGRQGKLRQGKLSGRAAERALGKSCGVNIDGPVAVARAVAKREAASAAWREVGQELY